MELIGKHTQDLKAGDFVLNIGFVERTTRKTYHGGSNYYWVEFNRPQFNQSAQPLKIWHLNKNPPKRVVTQGENIGGATID